MQDKYAADIGDFGKFILLKQLLVASPPQMRLGLNWYNVTTDEEPNNDGQHLKYLNHSYKKSILFKQCDPVLCEQLKSLVEYDRRSIAHLEDSAILPANTIYFSESIPLHPSDFKVRVSQRNSWFDRSAKVLSGVNAIFLDPDNGIQTPNVTKAQARMVKYAFLDEIKGLFDLCGFVVVYNHSNRSPQEVYRQKFIDAHEAVGSGSMMRVLRFKRFSVRDYVFLYRKEYVTTLDRLFDVLTNPPLDFLFSQFVI